MKVLIIEDEAPAFRRFEKLLLELDPNIEILDVLDSVTDTISWIKAHKSPDLIFMDIQLSDGISFEVFDQVEIKVPVVFTTAFDEYMLKAFRVNSIDYLLKPIKKDELAASLKKYETLKKQFATPQLPADMQEILSTIGMNSPTYKSRFLVKMGERMMSVPTPDIAYFYTQNSLVYLMTTVGKKYLLDQKLDEIQKQLDPEKWCRANRQYIVSFDSIAAVHKYFNGKLLVELDKQLPDEEITVSAEKATTFKQWMGA